MLRLLVSVAALANLLFTAGLPSVCEGQAAWRARAGERRWGTALSREHLVPPPCYGEDGAQIGVLQQPR